MNIVILKQLFSEIKKSLTCALNDTFEELLFCFVVEVAFKGYTSSNLGIWRIYTQSEISFKLPQTLYLMGF